jgi:antitoxin component HigA of HigAB toxin-antitoxin module
MIKVGQITAEEYFNSKFEELEKVFQKEFKNYIKELEHQRDDLLGAAEEAYQFMKFAVDMWPDAEICQESGATIEKLKRAIAGAYE